MYLILKINPPYSVHLYVLGSKNTVSNNTFLFLYISRESITVYILHIEKVKPFSSVCFAQCELWQKTWGGETSFPKKRAEWYMDRQTPWGIHVTNYI